MCDETSDEFNTLVKSLNYFFNKVLYSAQHEGEWSVDSIEQGLGWALYCEKAMQEPNLMYAAASYLKSRPFKEYYTVEDIKCLRKLLISNLFINQLVSEEVSHSLVKISLREFGSDETQQMLIMSIEKVKNYQIVVSAMRERVFENTFNILKVRLLIEATSSASVPYTALNHLLKSDGALGLLLKLSETLCENEKNKLLTCLGEWMSIELEKDNYPLFHQIASLSIDQTTFVCDTFPGLQIKLLAIINTIGNRLSNSDVEYENEINYKSLVSLCQVFLKSPNLSTVIKTAFSAWLTTKEASFWHNLFIEAQKENSS